VDNPGEVRVAVILPAYREATRVAAVVKGCLKHVQKVLVVDDCSPDHTAARASEAGAEVIRHDSNRGKGAALKTGFAHLLVLGFTHAIALDADGQHDPECIPSFIAAVTAPGVLLVLGNRFKDVRGMPFLRRITNRLMSWLISMICRTPVPDSQCGYRLVRLDNPVLYSAKADHFEYESEVLILTARAGGRIVSVPVPTTYGDEQSKIRPWADTKRFLRLLLRL
jgi:glycosyltransferase involved in cell wall biosynthesis